MLLNLPPFQLLILTVYFQSPTQAWSAGCLIDLYMDAMEEQEALKK